MMSRQRLDECNISQGDSALGGSFWEGSVSALGTNQSVALSDGGEKRKCFSFQTFNKFRHRKKHRPKGVGDHKSHTKQQSSDIKLLNDRLETVTSDKTLLEEKTKDLQNDRDQLKEKLQRASEENSELRKGRDDDAKVLQDANDKIERLENEKETSNIIILQLQKECEYHKITKQNVDKHLETSNNHQLLKDLGDAKSKVEDLEKDIAEENNNSQRLKKELGDCHHCIDVLRTDLSVKVQTLQQNYKEYNVLVNTVENNILSTNEHIKKLMKKLRISKLIFNDHVKYLDDAMTCIKNLEKTLKESCEVATKGLEDTIRELVFNSKLFFQEMEKSKSDLRSADVRIELLESKLSGYYMQKVNRTESTLEDDDDNTERKYLAMDLSGRSLDFQQWREIITNSAFSAVVTTNGLIRGRKKADMFIADCANSKYFDKLNAAFIPPVNGKYNISVCLIQRGQGKLEAYLVGGGIHETFMSSTEANGLSRNVMLKKGVGCWIEVRQAVGDAQLENCNFAGHLIG